MLCKVCTLFKGLHKFLMLVMFTMYGGAVIPKGRAFDKAYVTLLTMETFFLQYDFSQVFLKKEDQYFATFSTLKIFYPV